MLQPIEVKEVTHPSEIGILTDPHPLTNTAVRLMQKAGFDVYSREYLHIKPADDTWEGNTRVFFPAGVDAQDRLMVMGISEPRSNEWPLRYQFYTYTNARGRTDLKLSKKQQVLKSFIDRTSEYEMYITPISDPAACNAALENMLTYYRNHTISDRWRAVAYSSSPAAMSVRFTVFVGKIELFPDKYNDGAGIVVSVSPESTAGSDVNPSFVEWFARGFINYSQFMRMREEEEQFFANREYIMGLIQKADFKGVFSILRRERDHFMAALPTLRFNGIVTELACDEAQLRGTYTAGLKQVFTEIAEGIFNHSTIMSNLLHRQGDLSAISAAKAVGAYLGDALFSDDEQLQKYILHKDAKHPAFRILYGKMGIGTPQALASLTPLVHALRGEKPDTR